jgi:Uma2 family endonuclease
VASEPKRRYTLDEYLALERESDARYEFWNGEVFAMSGGTVQHDRIMGNLFNLLEAQLRGRGCRTFTNNMQLKVPSAPPYRYADGSVVSGQVDTERFSGNDLLLNPTLIFEVLSPTTEGYDRGDKFSHHKSIPSFREYLLVAQHRPHVTHYFREDGGTWRYEEFNDLADTVHLVAACASVALKDIYRDVDFTAA